MKNGEFRNLTQFSYEDRNRNVVPKYRISTDKVVERITVMGGNQVIKHKEVNGVECVKIIHNFKQMMIPVNELYNSVFN